MAWSLTVPLVALAAFAARTAAAATGTAPTLANAKSSLTLLYQNNLNATDDQNHIGAILLDANTLSGGATACAAIGESLISKASIKAHQPDFVSQLNYVSYAGRAPKLNAYYIDGGIVAVDATSQSLTFPKTSDPSYVGQKLPVLCSQSSNQGQPYNAVATASNQLSVAAAGNTYVGYRNQKSFRFLGIRYANTPARFTYSTQYSGTGQVLQATAYGSQCAQGGSGSEDCLFLNIQTPYIPKAGSTANLRPVMFWIHGGGFTGGSGADAGSDGGNLASREDIVVVNINYRLSTLGFLAIPGTNITGNFGIGDQVTALQWTVANIAKFGGDPSRITIIGESAGAGSVRTLLGSPPAIGHFQGAVAMSNLGGGVGLGLGGDYATTYSDYDTIAQSYATAGQNIFRDAGCMNATLADQITCLKGVDALKLVGLNDVARYVVQDGKYVVTERLPLTAPNADTAHVAVIFGVTHDDGASFSTYPRTPVTTELAGIQASLGISASYAQSIINSGLFPYYDTGNITLDSFNVSARVATDIQFRCIDQATIYAGATSGAFADAWYYQMDRTYGGYDPNNLGGPANNNPELPYFRLHGSDMPNVFGNLGSLRDANDLYTIQVGAAYFGAFTRQLQPNPEPAYLSARNYKTVISATKKAGTWNPVSGKKGPIRIIDAVPTASSFIDVPQCAFLNYSLDYYFSGR